MAAVQQHRLLAGARDRRPHDRGRRSRGRRERAQPRSKVFGWLADPLRSAASARHPIIGPGATTLAAALRGGPPAVHAAHSARHRRLACSPRRYVADLRRRSTTRSALSCAMRGHHADALRDLPVPASPSTAEAAVGRPYAGRWRPRRLLGPPIPARLGVSASAAATPSSLSCRLLLHAAPVEDLNGFKAAIEAESPRRRRRPRRARGPVGRSTRRARRGFDFAAAVADRRQHLHGAYAVADERHHLAAATWVQVLAAATGQPSAFSTISSTVSSFSLRAGGSSAEDDGAAARRPARSSAEAGAARQGRAVDDLRQQHAHLHAAEDRSLPSSARRSGSRRRSGDPRDRAGGQPRQISREDSRRGDVEEARAAPGREHRRQHVDAAKRMPRKQPSMPPHRRRMLPPTVTHRASRSMTSGLIPTPTIARAESPQAASTSAKSRRRSAPRRAPRRQDRREGGHHAADGGADILVLEEYACRGSPKPGATRRAGQGDVRAPDHRRPRPGTRPSTARARRAGAARPVRDCW